MSAPATASAPGVVKADEEVKERLLAGAAQHLHALGRDPEDPKSLDPRARENTLKAYNPFRKAYFADGVTSGHLKAAELIRALWPGIQGDPDPQAWRRKNGSLWRYLRRLEAAGVLRTRVHTDRRGMIDGIEWELVDEPPDPMAWPDLKSYSARVYPARAASPCSSTGRAADS